MKRASGGRSKTGKKAVTGHQWTVLVALGALDCLVLAALAWAAMIHRSNDRAAAQRIVDLPEVEQAVSTPTASPTLIAETPAPPRPTREPTRVDPTATLEAPTATSTPSRTPAFTPIASPVATSTALRTATPSRTLAPQPIALPPANTVADALIQPFAGEAYRRRIERARLDPDYARRVDQKLNQGRINFLLFGYGETHEPPVAVDVIIGSLSILSYDVRTGRVDVVSLTHDTRAPEIERFLAQRGKPSAPVKIDQAYDVGGFDLMRRTVEDATGLSVDFQIAFKDTVLINLVDDVFGSIAVDNPADFKVQPFYLNGQLFEEGRFGKGRQQLNGTQTIQYIKALTARHDAALERNVRKMIVFRGLLDGANQRCHDRDFWLRLSGFVAGQAAAKTIQYDFDPLALLASNLGEVISVAGRFAKAEGCDLGASRIRKSIYVVDAAVGNGGVQWVSMAVLTNPVAKRDLASGVYPAADVPIEVPINGNPYGDLIAGYWQAVRSLVKQIQV